MKQRLESLVLSARKDAGFSGVVLAATDGKAIYEGAFGYSHLKQQTPNTAETPFRIASLSKQFTAAAVLFLESNGKLSIHDPIHKYLPSFGKESHRAITVYHLLTHTSGLPRVPEGNAGRERWSTMSRSPTPVDAYVQLAAETPLKHTTGERFEYSNFGFRVLSAVIEKVSGKTFADFMEQDVFQPLCMNQTGVARISQPESEARVAEGLIFQGYSEDTGEPNYVLDDSGRNYGCGYGSGGIYTSANDLIKWDRILAGTSFLPAKQKKTLFQPTEGNTYACGWVIASRQSGEHAVHSHSGSNQAYFSLMTRIPGGNFAFVVLGNFRRTDESRKFMSQLEGLISEPTYNDVDLPVDESKLAKIEGVFESDDGNRWLEMKIRDGKITHRTQSSSREYQLKWQGDLQFLIRRRDGLRYLFTFHENEGTVNEVTREDPRGQLRRYQRVTKESDQESSGKVKDVSPTNKAK